MTPHNRINVATLLVVGLVLLSSSLMFGGSAVPGLAMILVASLISLYRK